MWETLTEDQKQKYKMYCDNKFGKTFSFCETGEPLYFNDDGFIIDTDIIIELLFSISEN